MKRMLLIIIFIISSLGISQAKPKYAEETGRDCTFCHDVAPPALNDLGMYYAQHHTFAGYHPPEKTIEEKPEEPNVGVKLHQWDMGIIAFATLFVLLSIIFALKL
ncbi:MAG: hypothetical protein ACE5K4_08475 [Candidatus Hydrothermarchaeota archaeon]